MDHILYWNDVALEANRRDFSNVPGTNKPMPEQGGPTLSSRALAIVHLAMYDAHAGASNKRSELPAYLPNLPSADGADPAEATAYAAHTTLVALFPRQKAFFDEKLKDSGSMVTGSSPGKIFGECVGNAILVDRQRDPNAGAAGYMLSKEPPHHRVDPVNPTSPDQLKPHAPLYGALSKCFAVTERHELSPPYKTSDSAYKQSSQQVLGLGILPTLMGTLPAGVAKRTPDQTFAGIFWAYDGVRDIGTPPRLYNQIVRQVAEQHKNDVDKNARLFALVNVAMGDAGILAWDQKYIHDLWRPSPGIRDGKLGDPSWLPLGAPQSNSYVDEAKSGDREGSTPPFPAYPSGHATFGAAALHIVRLFYGVPSENYGPDTVFTGEIGSDELNGKTRDSNGVLRPKHERTFPNGLWQMIEENGLSRVYLGVHWSFDAFALDAAGKPDVASPIGGVPLGLAIAEDIFAVNGKAPAKSKVGPRVNADNC
jgi:hypothetical protein